MLSAYLSQRVGSSWITATTTAAARKASKTPLYYALPASRKATLLQRKHNLTTIPIQDRYRSASSYLYARRILELAAASAASLKHTALLQEALEKPDAWQNYYKKDWTHDLQQEIGSPLKRLWLSTRRILALTALACPLACMYPISLFSPKVKDFSWNYALWAIEQSGPTFIKLVQWATTRQDLFSVEFCSHFGKLRDETRGHSWNDTHDILQQSLGENYPSLLQLDNVPIGSGCIAQVYRGILLQDTSVYPKGTELAVKVQHPGIWTKVCVDFYLLQKVALFLESLPGLNLDYLSIQDTVHQFLNVMLPQLDLRLEAKHLARFNQDFVSEDRVQFPRALKELTHKQVLVETFMNGKPIMEYLTAPMEQRKEIAKLGLETVLKMIFLNDFVHGDLHPGNILVEEEGDLKLGLLDCGLVIEMGPEQHVNLVRVLGAFVRRDGTEAGQLMVDTASKCQASPLDVQLFVQGIEKICRDDEENNFLEKVGDYIADICFLACKHKVKLEASFINAALAVEIIEGIASALYPNMSVQKMALPMVVKAEMMHRLPSFSVSGWG